MLDKIALSEHNVIDMSSLLYEIGDYKKVLQIIKKFNK